MRDGQRILLVGLTVIALFCWAWTASALWRLQDLNRRLTAMKGKRLALTHRLQEAKELTDRYERVIRELGTPLKRFNPGKLTAQLMEWVEGALLQSQLKTEIIQPLAWQILPGEGCARFAVQVTATTTQEDLTEGLQAITELLLRLRSLRPPVIAERLNLQVLERPPFSFRLQMQLAWFVPLEREVLKRWAPEKRRTPRR